jgi:Tfp pilus assembly pilus retraction ATPase PilT
MKQLNIKLRDEEREEIYINAKKTNSTVTDYCKSLILGHEIENTITAQTVDRLIEFWKELQKTNISEELLEKLKQIILSLK